MVMASEGPFDLEFPPRDDTGVPPAEPEDEGLSLDEFMVDYAGGDLTETPLNLRLECNRVFGPGGLLAAEREIGGQPGEERPQQELMALAVADALEQNRNLCLEAPTGVGKSFAYLVPLIYRSQQARLPVVITTETITLQQQLIDKDLPFLRRLTGVPFTAVLAKGRHNYLCLRRLELLEGEQRDALLPSAVLLPELNRLHRNLEEGLTGERFIAGDDVSSDLWNLVCSESGSCAGKECPCYRSCCYFKERRKWEHADIIVANHALFLTDLAIRAEDENSSLLPEYGAVLIDEAHTLENSAAEHLGLTVSQSALLSFINRLFNPERNKGLLMRPGEKMMGLRTLARAIHQEIYGFFAFYTAKLAGTGNGPDPGSIRLPAEITDDFEDLLSPALTAMAHQLNDAAEEENEEALKTELNGARDRCLAYTDAIDQFKHRLIPDAVYYIELEHRFPVLKASPLNVAELLRAKLFTAGIPVMLCSATLTVRNSFDYYVSRTGFDAGPLVRLDSPFSPEQAQLIVDRNMPDPVAPSYLPELITAIRDYALNSDGGVFVLFTNYQTLRQCANALREEFAAAGRRLLEQGGDLNRHRMLTEFKADGHAILFGADSFWTGVDVPGKALSTVIITKLPFASPGQPLVAARQEKLRAERKSDFAGYLLPEAILKFRQGVGRLIRNRGDRGKIIILDPRVVTKAYGRGFLESIPYREKF